MKQSKVEEESRLDLLIVHFLDFTNIAVNLLNTTDDKYERFFEKLYNKDKRSLYFYIMKHKNEISENQLNFAKKYYELRGRYLKWK